MFLSVVKHDEFIIKLLEQNKMPPTINNSIYAPKVTAFTFVQHLKVKVEMKILW